MKSYHVLLYIGIGLAIYFALFGWLDWLPIKKFDESRLAVNAVEMAQSGNWLVTTYEGKPDLWNTKPPLLIWLQSILIRILGINETAIRLPSALFALGICVTIYFFAKKYFSKKIGLYSMLVLITSYGFVNDHGARSGDYDTAVTFFLLIQAISFFEYLQSGKDKYIWLFYISLTSAILTKSIVGILFFPAYFIYLIYLGGEAKMNLKYFVLGFLASISIVSLYYVLRESANAGYIDAVIQNEITGRYLNTLEGHQKPFLFYFDTLINGRFSPWCIFTIIGFFISYSIISNRKLVAYLGILIASFLLIISFGGTKLIWYSMPIFPMMSILASLGIQSIFQRIYEQKPKLSYIFIGLIFTIPYYFIFDKSFNPKISESEFIDYRLAYYIKNHKKELSKLKPLKIMWNDYQPQSLFYYYQLKKFHPQVQRTSNLDSGDILFFADEKTRQFVDSTYIYEDLLPNNPYEIKLYRILE